MSGLSCCRKIISNGSVLTLHMQPVLQKIAGFIYVNIAHLHYYKSVLRLCVCAGVKIVFRVGLVLLRQMLGSVDKLRELQGMYETMERLRNISPDSIKEEILVHEVTTHTHTRKTMLSDRTLM